MTPHRWTIRWDPQLGDDAAAERTAKALLNTPAWVLEYIIRGDLAAARDVADTVLSAAGEPDAPSVQDQTDGSRERDEAVDRACGALYEMSRGRLWPGVVDGLDVSHVGLKKVAEVVLRAALIEEADDAYVVTTKRPGHRSIRDPFPPAMLNVASRHAVATLEEARAEAHRIVNDQPHRLSDPLWNNAIEAWSRSGGTVGPLPDGMVIEVEPTSKQALFDALPVDDQRPLPTWPMPTLAMVIYAFNDREAARHA